MKKKNRPMPWEKECPRCRTIQTADTTHCPSCQLDMTNIMYVAPEIVDRMKKIASGELTVSSDTNNERPWRKTCPQCGMEVAAYERICDHCKYKFSKNTVISCEEAEQLERQAIKEKERATARAAALESEKNSSPKAPRKVCPGCNKKILISRVDCPYCEYHFISKWEIEASAKPTKKKAVQKESTETTQAISAPKSPYERSNGFPIVSILMFLIPILFLASISVYALFYVYHFALSFVAMIAAVILGLVWYFIGKFIGIIASCAYGRRPSSYSSGMIAIVVICMVAIDVYFLCDPFDNFAALKEQYLDDKGITFLIASILAVWNVGVIGEAIGWHWGIMEDYCHRCDLSNMMILDKKVVTSENFEHRFKTHEAETRTGTIDIKTNISSFDSHATASSKGEYEYTIPAWQEYLGHYKITEYTEYYVCQCCGHVQTKTSKSEEKVG